MRGKASLVAGLLCCTIILGTGLVYYPKWKEDRTEATLSWDVSGYYFYLPATFIYQDLKQLAFKDKILEQYHPTPELLQAREWHNGNYVMKYSAGMALQYLPFFAMAHAYACLTDYPADGFSRPYQLAVFLGSLLVALIGIWLLRMLLRHYFDDITTAIVLLAMVSGTNYLDYAAINGAMSHNYLFTWYCALVLLTVRYWTRPSGLKAVAIGAIIGVMVLTRPSEMIAVVIPVLWGVDSKETWRVRYQRLTQHRGHWWKAAAAIVLISAIQMVYWTYVAGTPIVYSYEHGFNFLKPRIADGLFDFRIGWLTYSPLLAVPLAGFYFLFKKHRKVFFAATLFMLLYLWLTLSWTEWTYGGSLGHRAMIQSYPMLAFGLAAVVAELLRSRTGRLALFFTVTTCALYNAWLIHHAHKGGLFKAGQMTSAYFWEVLGKNQVAPDIEFLLDYDEMHRGARKNVRLLETNGFDQIQTECGPWSRIRGEQCVEAGQLVTLLELRPDSLPTRFVRASAMITSGEKEWNIYQMPLLGLQLVEADGSIVKQNAVRVFRILGENDDQRLFVDMEIPGNRIFETMRVICDNTRSQVTLKVDNVDLIGFTPG